MLLRVGRSTVHMNYGNYIKRPFRKSGKNYYVVYDTANNLCRDHR